jgi:glycosyltransferase involved in cell wall biosynthesis
MRLSIITPSFNQGIFIEQTILSVLDQDHTDVEHIVVDGGSTDSTVQVLKRYGHLRWVSERDRGQADAINKGFRQATGEIMAWINSDDFYAPRVFGSVMRYFQERPDCHFLYGDITFVDRNGVKVAEFGGATMSYRSLVDCPDLVRQPSCFWRRSVVEDVGGVDEGLHLVMDLDFILRIAKRYPLHHVPLLLSFYRTYPENKSRSMARQQLREFIQVYRKQQIHIGVRSAWFLIKKFLLLFRPMVVLQKTTGRLRRAMRSA